jgi:magnesium chelatase family protein
MRARVLEARLTQRRQGFNNAHLPPSVLRQACMLDESGEWTLEMAIRRLSLSARAHDRILKVARTIADLGRAETVAAKALGRGHSVSKPGPELLELAYR